MLGYREFVTIHSGGHGAPVPPDKCAVSSQAPVSGRHLLANVLHQKVDLPPFPNLEAGVRIRKGALPWLEEESRSPVRSLRAGKSLHAPQTSGPPGGVVCPESAKCPPSACVCIVRIFTSAKYQNLPSRSLPMSALEREEWGLSARASTSICEPNGTNCF